jgi:hypothetical protein
VLLETPVWLLPILRSFGFQLVLLRFDSPFVHLLGVNWRKRFVTKLPYQRLTLKIVSLAFLEAALYCSHAFRFLKPKTANRSLLRRYFIWPFL